MAVTTVGTTTVHVIGKCPVKGCATRKRNTFPARVEATPFGARTRWTMPTEAGGMSPKPSVAGPYARPSTYPLFFQPHYRAWLESMYAHGWVCEQHDQFCKTVVVAGVVNTEKSCNARCEAATGPNCECACGGELHGMAHA